jgi:outer membrane immunogenic protein
VRNRHDALIRVLIARAVDAIMSTGVGKFSSLGALQMNRILLATAAALGALLIAAPAIADEAPPVKHVRAAPRQAPERAAPAQSQPSWTGSQVGGQGGTSSVAQGFAEPGAYLFPAVCGGSSLCQETPFSFSGNRTGATGGGFLGYRIQFGTMVAGIEGDINAKSVSSSSAAYDTNSFRAESFYGTVKQGADGSIRGRLGFLVTPWTLVYGTGGVAFGSVSGSFAYSANEHSCVVCSSVVGGGSWSTTRTGATGGAGVETLIFPSWTLRLEYRYTDLGRFSENVGLRTTCPVGTCSSPSGNALINLHPTDQAVRLGVGYNF